MTADATKVNPDNDPKDDTPPADVTPEQQVEDSEKFVDKIVKQLEGHRLQKGAAKRLMGEVRSRTI